MAGAEECTVDEAGARRKRRPKMCPNPLFVKWVEEFRDQAKEKGSKSHYTYTKALNSLKKYPLPLSSGQEAKILDYVGERLAKMLDKRLAEHNSGKDSPTYTAIGTPSSSHSRCRGVKSPARARKRANPATNSLASALPSPPLSVTSPPDPAVRRRLSDGKHTPKLREDGSIGPSKLKKKKTPHEYIPVYRSGAYAILVALYNVEQRPGYRGYLTKAELITEAQPHCDASFTIPDPGSYYTTWSAMSSLVERGFVRRVKHPPRFSLTDAGVSLALRLIEGGAPSLLAQGQTTGSRLPPSKDGATTPAAQRKRRKKPSASPPLVTSPAPAVKHHSPIVLGSTSPAGSNTTDLYDLEDCDTMEWDSDLHRSVGGASEWTHTPDTDARAPLHASPNLSSGSSPAVPALQFWYVNTDGKCVRSKDCAAVTFNDDFSVGFLIRCQKALLEASGVKYTTDPSSPNLSSGSSPAVPALQFWYVNTDGKCVRSKDCAAVTFNDDFSVGFLIRCQKALLEASGVKYTTDPSRKTESQFVYVYLSNDDAPDYCSPPEDGGVAGKLADGGRLTSPPSTSTRTYHAPNPSATRIHPSIAAVQTKAGPKRVSPITLSDSNDSDSDIEVVPLAERIGLRGPTGDQRGGILGTSTGKESLGEKGRKGSSDRRGCAGHGGPVGRSKKDETSTSQSLGHTRTRVTPTDGGSGCGSSVELDPCDRRSSIDRDGSGTGRPNQGLSPGQAAGLAALRRLEALQSKQSTGSGCSSYTPMSAGGTHTTGVCDLTGGPHLEDSSFPHQRRFIDKDTAATKKICNEKRQPSPSLPRPAPATHVHRTTAQGASRTARSQTCDSAPHLSDNESSSSGVDSSHRGSSTNTVTCTLSSAPSTSKTSSRPVADEAVDLSSPEFVLRPGSFEVILCVDSSESAASRKSKAHFRGLLLQELGKNGVKYDVRRMHVGDFVWLAKESVAPRPGELGCPPSQEVVLEHIVERKRMDDLAGSIMDGRFQEQKFRLTNCGVRYPVYLVEEYGEVNHAKLGERALEQAVANTQIIDGFFVKRTKDIRESVAYLTIMTRYLQNHYAGKTIKAYPCDTVVQLNRMSRRNEDANVVCSMDFEKFNDASVKTKPLTVYEMFGRHLIQVPQSSADKAVAILERYPTISHLREAYRHCETDKERENLLRDIKTGPNQRKLGPILSGLICSLYWKGQ